MLEDSGTLVEGISYYSQDSVTPLVVVRCNFYGVWLQPECQTNSLSDLTEVLIISYSEDKTLFFHLTSVFYEVSVC